MKSDEKRKIIVVIGPGRSGTSLLMQILNAVGFATTKEQIDLNISNPKGFWEDRELVDLQKKFLEQLKPLHFPRDSDEILSMQGGRILVDEIKKVLSKKIENTDKPFALKDPRITELFPIWKKVFKDLKLEPVYILACRDPESVVFSNKKIVEDRVSQEELEWIWLFRILSCFFHTSGEIFVVHYEKWFTDGKNQFSNLLKYLSVDVDYNSIKNVFDGNLNRSKKNNVSIENYVAKNVYQLIWGMTGDARNDSKNCKELILKWQEMLSYMEWLRPELMKRDKQLNFLLSQESEMKLKINQKNKEISEKVDIIKQRNDLINEKNVELIKNRDVIQKIMSTKIWKMREIFLKIKNSFFAKFK